MKRKDILYLGVALAIIAVAAMLLLNGNKQSSGGPTVEIVPVIEPNYSKAALAEINNESAHRNFAVKVDLSSELGNTQPFGR